jgi:hypothetical protein
LKDDIEVPAWVGLSGALIGLGWAFTALGDREGVFEKAVPFVIGPLLGATFAGVAAAIAFSIAQSLRRK